jgi:hypothetical protein
VVETEERALGAIGAKAAAKAGLEIMMNADENFIFAVAAAAVLVY